MMVFQTFATDLLEPREAERLFEGVATVAENMSRDRFERPEARLERLILLRALRRADSAIIGRRPAWLSTALTH